MSTAIEDARALPGETVHDQDGQKIGPITHLYALGEDDSVMWVTVEASIGIGDKRQLFVPLARLKHERGELSVPYSAQHVQGSPQVEPVDELSEGDDHALRAYYAIGYADQELRTDNDSYASQVPEAGGLPRRLESP